jgi:hypothetical protein
MKPNNDARVSQIPAHSDEDSLRGKEPEIPENATENALPDGKVPENRNAEKAVAKTGHATKRPQIPASGAKNRPHGTQPENSENDPENSPPDGKLPENRNAEKAIRKTRRASKRPQIPASGAKNRPRSPQPENFENDTENSPPDEKPQTPEGRKSAGPNPNPALALLNAHPRKFANVGLVVPTWKYYKGRKLGPYYRLQFRLQGRTRHVYLGREGPRVQAVRERLAELHAVLARRRMYDKMVKRARAQVHVDLAALQRQLAAAGLRSKAIQVRGLRADFAGR